MNNITSNQVVTQDGPAMTAAELQHVQKDPWVIQLLIDWYHVQDAECDAIGEYPNICKALEARRHSLEQWRDELLKRKGEEPGDIPVADLREYRTQPPETTGDQARAEFFSKHALGPLARPSCLVCGEVPKEWPPGIQHAELPGVIVCTRCRDAAQVARRVGQEPWRVSLPKITAELQEEWRDSLKLMEWSDGHGYQWTQEAVDFACMLQGVRADAIAHQETSGRQGAIDPDDPDEILLDFVNQYDQGPGATYEFDRVTVLKMLRDAFGTRRHQKATGNST